MNKFEVLSELSDKYTSDHGLETIEGFTIQQWFMLSVDEKISELLKTG